MAKDEVLARVERDLACGHTHPALQRLASLTADHPQDLQLRARRAAVHRQVGNPVEAGRWGYLTEEVTAEEIAAYERAVPDARRRLGALRLAADPGSELGPRARQRYTDLLRQAGGAPACATAGSGADGSESWRDALPCLVAAVGGVLVIGLAVVGLIAVLRLIW